MPPEVLSNYKAGMTPVEAYQEYLLAQKNNNELVKNKAKEDAAKAASAADAEGEK